MKLKIESSKIKLRKLKKSDAEDIYLNARDKEIARYTTLPHPYKLRHALDFIKKTHRDIRKKAAYELGIELKETGRIIGMMSFVKIDHANKNAEVGYWLGKKYWRRGIAKEALKLILEFGFKKLGLIRVYAKVLHPNTASAKLLESVGFKYEGTLRKSVFRWNKWYDVVVYGLLKEEYISNCLY